MANVKKICRLDELKDFCCCYCWAIEAHVHTVGIVVRNSELPYSYHLCPTMPYLLGFWYFLPRTVIRSPNQKVSTLTQITEDFTDSVPKASPNDISLAMWYVLSRGKQRGRNVGSSKENEYINLERPPATLPHPPLPPQKSTSSYIGSTYCTKLLPYHRHPFGPVQQSYLGFPNKTSLFIPNRKKNTTNFSSPSIDSSPGRGEGGFTSKDLQVTKRKSRIPCFANLRTVKVRMKNPPEKGKRKKNKKERKTWNAMWA